MKIIKKLFTKENTLALLLILVTLHPIIELDYLAYNFFNRIGLPRLSTIVNLILYPALVLIVFFLYEKNKKKVLKLFIVYVVIFGIYFAWHCYNANILQYNMHLTNNFVFLLKDEVVYAITLLIPLVYVYVFSLSNINIKVLKKTIIGLCVLISIPVLLSNLFVFGMSTYQGYTIDNLFSWFRLPFDNDLNHPRLYASKFFFQEGNTIGIILFMLLPFLYYFLYKSEDKKEKVFLVVLILIQSFAMMVLSTRIATYGAALIPVIVLVIYIFMLLLKYEKLNKLFIVILVVFTLINSVVLKYSPAYQNQLIDAQNYELIRRESYQKNEANSYREDGDELEPYSEEWLNFYTYMFEVYHFLMNVTPPQYYQEYYDYRVDPKFWVDFIFDYELEERVNGRQTEAIFTHYKYDDLSVKDKMLGMGYGTFMRGSFLLERDFAQQFFTLGYVGFILLMCPWIIIVAYLGIKLILGYKKKKWNFLNIILMMSICAGICCSYVSGHVLDQLSSSMIISMLCGFLFINLNKKVEE